jgi:ATP-dependent Clp protease ATP-binding subunit ClpB
VDFKNTAVIMTSNLGSQYIVDLSAPEQREQVRSRVNEALKQAFRPEFLNRVDEVIIFESLGREQLERIVDIQASRLAARLEERHISVELTLAAKQLLVEEGYDPAYGARPLKRIIQRRLLDPIALKLLKGEFEEGDTIEVDAKDGQFELNRLGQAAAAA